MTRFRDCPLRDEMVEHDGLHGRAWLELRAELTDSSDNGDSGTVRTRNRVFRRSVVKGARPRSTAQA
jgi:hypothetical protein